VNLRRTSRLLRACVVAFAIAPAAVMAQSTPPAPTPPPGQPAQAEPSLDDLLGLPFDKKPANQPEKQPDKQADQPGPSDAATDSALDRALSAEAPGDDFAQAVALMRDTAGRLTRSRDPGLDTQRLQEQILRKLDKLIDDAKKNQQQQQQQQQRQQQQQQQQQQQSSQRQQPSRQQGNQAQGSDIAKQEGPLNQSSAGASAAWGNLPPHVRDALLQGSSDRFSTTYQRLTEEYYKRLAAQDKTQGVTAPTPTPVPMEGTPR